MKTLRRALFLACLCIAHLFTLNASYVEAKGHTPEALASINILKDGNARFANSKLAHPNQTLERRNELISGQNPKAVVISCSDSRVPPEIIFDQGLGDLFVVRVAGNVLNDENIGSVEYAALHTGATVVVVMGHKKCGAVTAAVNGGDIPGHIKSITDAIQPAVDEAKKLPKSVNIVEEVSHLNVKHVVKQLKSSQPILAKMLQDGKLGIVGAYYDLDTGKVEWLK